MTRVKGGINTHKRHTKILKAAKGFRGPRGKRYSKAKEAVMKQGTNAYIGRRHRRREMRRMWITRIQAACRANGVNYSRFIEGLTKRAILLDRKVLADLAVAEPGTFKALVEESSNK